ncbi:glycoside hydrolase family 97 protein [bacterium]|nr:glycoside hydrolase family 97 protein [bacterium]
MNNITSILKTFLIITVFSIHLNGYADEYSLSSPNNRIEVKIENNQKIQFSVTLNGNELISPSSISLNLRETTVLGENAVVTDMQREEINRVIVPVVKQKSETIVERCNELRLIFKSNFNLVFRAYNEGVAYRFETHFDNRIKIASEEVTFNFALNDTAFFPEEESFMSHNERLYEKLTFGDMTPGSFCSLPVLVNTHSGNHVLITEADLEDYPGLWLKANENHTFSGILPGVALEEEQQNDRNVRISKVADFIAETQGSRTYPWRVMAIGETDADLILNQMVFMLSKPLQLEDTSWIKPGKVAWDWWNALNLYGVDFKAGINTETYKYYIDFASKYGIEYIILDEGWYELGDLMSINPDIDMETLLAYGKEKNVGIILWVVWKTLEDQLEMALDQFEEWGVKGIKVDFMQRDDQWMVNYYWKIAREAAKRKLLVDFHGSYKPSGLRRAYPNVLTREGVRGLEHCKWSNLFVPGHEVTIPFIRMVAGPMDYTPGAMNNAQRRNYRPINARPMSMGTRCHQLAMYVVFESPLQMLADSPSNYLREPECMAFLEKVPTVWDETVALYAKVEDYIAVARRNGDDWYVGVMTDENARAFDIDFSFLDSDEYTVESYQDGVNADSYASDYKRTISTVSRNQHVQIELAQGGGWAARIVKK